MILVCLFSKFDNFCQTLPAYIKGITMVDFLNNINNYCISKEDFDSGTRE